MISDPILVPPPSKSDAQRALATAFILDRPDLLPLLDLERAPNDVRVFATGLRALRSNRHEVLIDCEDGGFPFRVLLCLAATRPHGSTTFFGTQRLGERPHGPLFKALGHRTDKSSVVWPITVDPLPAAHPPRFEVDARSSSQFASGLLFAAAAMAQRQCRPWTVVARGPMASAGYYELSKDWLRHGGFRIETSASTPDDVTIIHQPSPPPSRLPPIPGDWSSLGYLLLASWASGAAVADVDLTAPHPDRAFVEVAVQAGLMLIESDGLVRLTGEPRHGVTASAAIMPDAIPALVALATALPEPSRFSDPEVLRSKESDRLDGLIELVRAAGGRAFLESSGALVVEPLEASTAPIHVATRGDHRLAMAGATLALLHRRPIRVDSSECVRKSFPGFWDEFGKVFPSMG